MMKKQLIMEKALELFAIQGFGATTVQQITEYCGISKGAFYLSFKSKDELILALIDHFMIQFTSDIDQIVRNSNEDLLYKFFYATFHSFQKHSDFAKLLIKEQTQSINKELFLKVRYYDRLMDETILFMIERLYGEKINHTKFDLIYCIKGFMNTYSHLFLYMELPFDLDLLSKSLVEKTNLLAEKSSIPFITKELIDLFKQPDKGEVTKEHIGKLLEEKIEEMEDSIEKESLILLKQNLDEPNFNSAIVKGLIENIRTHSECKWISYLLMNFYKL
ncbi:TetR/AcrR family transcriptional regulator [Bacillus sp. S/N-304-OC-R1]|uniref:TetR/AcrR family transcriptional regulator n=1 Tax=Bacillus sp. S/N-304-OC-R1 TaxID=2758034 RepID=UPI001C8E9BD5|nr:TetR/AcrR family transcriptional regulator [Bacillus sp. S/N-304-OC-R1]MBY0121996.1 TetR/AcrR family transcriptional regulator [Bacillus sp. S/N-304-OC-R1]